MRNFMTVFVSLVFCGITLGNHANAQGLSPAAVAPPAAGTGTPPQYKGEVAIRIEEDTPQNIAFVIDDNDGDLGQVKLKVPKGSLSVTKVGTLNIQGNDTGDMTIDTGTQADINATLKSLIYKPCTNCTGETTVSIIATDKQNNQISKTVDLNINRSLTTGKVCDWVQAWPRKARRSFVVVMAASWRLLLKERRMPEE